MSALEHSPVLVGKWTTDYAWGRADKGSLPQRREEGKALRQRGEQSRTQASRRTYTSSDTRMRHTTVTMRSGSYEGSSCGRRGEYRSRDGSIMDIESGTEVVRSAMVRPIYSRRGNTHEMIERLQNSNRERQDDLL
ncbi:hypothetical protein Tco_1375315 [Tanacetum coccineum]